MNKKIFENARFTPKGDIEANWKKAVGFIPLDKEIIIYKPDESHSYSRMKIGDGVTGINDLPFVVDVEGELASKEWVAKQEELLGISLQEYVDNSVQGLATEEYVNEAIAAIDLPEVEIDQTYDAESQNAQSGVAVAEAIEPLDERTKDCPRIEKVLIEIINGEYKYYDMGGIGVITGNFNNNYEFEIFPNEMNLILDGIKYDNLQCKRFPDINDFVMLGNLKKLAPLLAAIGFEYDYEDTGEPFGFFISKKDFYFIAGDPEENSSYNIILSSLDEKVIKLDQKYLPDEVWVQPDWKQNNLFAKDYIKNKPYVNTVYDASSTNAQSGLAVAEAIKQTVDQTINPAIELIQDQLDDNIMICTFNITEENKNINILWDKPVPMIDWGDGTIEKNTYSRIKHQYELEGLYTCKIYGVSGRLEGGWSDASGYHGFHGNKQLESIIIPNTITSIGQSAFSGCSNLTSINIPNSVDVIENEAFSNCFSLTNIVIPDSVTNINSIAFIGCNNLTNITFSRLTPITYKPWFNDCTLLTKIFVPHDSVEAYKIAWSDVADKIDAIAYISDIDILRTEVSNINNIENGTEIGTIQQIPDNVADGFDFTNKNPNATILDPSLTGIISYGATGEFASAFGGKSAAMGKRSHTEGTTTIAKGKYSHAEGDNAVALGDQSHAEGYGTVAAGLSSHAEGVSTLANGQGAHTEGLNTKATAEGAHAEGVDTEATGVYSHAEGNHTKALHNNSHAGGFYTKTGAVDQTVIGHYNVGKTDTLFEVGNGDNGKDSNAFEVNKNGDIYVANSIVGKAAASGLVSKLDMSNGGVKVVLNSVTPLSIDQFSIFLSTQSELSTIAMDSGFLSLYGAYGITLKSNYGKYILPNETYGDTNTYTLATQEYVNSKLVNVIDYLGVANSMFDLATSKSITTGDYYRVGTEFEFGTETAHVGDILISLITTNTPAASPFYWDLVHTHCTLDNVVTLTDYQDILGRKTFKDYIVLDNDGAQVVLKAETKKSFVTVTAEPQGYSNSSYTGVFTIEGDQIIDTITTSTFGASAIKLTDNSFEYTIVRPLDVPSGSMWVPAAEFEISFSNSKGILNLPAEDGTLATQQWVKDYIDSLLVTTYEEV